MVFDLVNQVARNEYDVSSTNFYAFYFGDGEVFHDDAEQILEIIDNDMLPIFNRVGVTEVKPSGMSQLVSILEEQFQSDLIVRLSRLKDSAKIKKVICELFR